MFDPSQIQENDRLETIALSGYRKDVGTERIYVAGGLVSNSETGSTNSIFDNYNVIETADSGKLTITARPITITAASEEFTYDGEEHDNENVTVTVDPANDKLDLAEGHYLEATATGKVTNVVDTEENNNPIKEGYKVLRDYTVKVTS